MDRTGPLICLCADKFGWPKAAVLDDNIQLGCQLHYEGTRCDCKGLPVKTQGRSIS
jgi:hypothetical protein